MTHLGDKPLRAIEAYRLLLEEGGFKSLFRGSGLIVGRGYLCAAILLPLYDHFFLKLLDSEQWTI